MNDAILKEYEIRKSNKEKTAFIAYIKERLMQSGYDVEKDITVETKGRGLFKSRNIVVGSPKEAEVFVTAHYDTCAVIPIPNLITPTNPVLFILYQLFLVVVFFLLAGMVAYPVMMLCDNFFAGYYTFLAVVLLIVFQLMFGYRNKHTANDNTSGTIAITKLLEMLPQEQRAKVCVVYFDNEEKGLLGSAFFIANIKMK